MPRLKQFACSACGNVGTVSVEDRDFPESGLRNVILKQVDVLRCGACGNDEVVISRLNDVMQTLAKAVVSQPYPLRGEEIRFLRKHLGMTQVAFARLIGIDHTNLSKWENNRERPGEQSDRLMRMYLLTLGNLGDTEQCKQMVTRFQDIHEGEPGTTVIDPKHLSYELLSAT